LTYTTMHGNTKVKFILEVLLHCHMDVKDFWFASRFNVAWCGEIVGQAINT